MRSLEGRLLVAVGLLVVVAQAPGYSFAVGLASTGAVVVYVLRGWMVSGTGARGLVDLGLAPVYVAWKMTLRFRRPVRATSDWVRTEREAGPSGR